MERGLIKTSVGYIHYRKAGQGKPILLLHPLPRASDMFIELMEALRGKLWTLAPDYPSYGMSDHLPGHPTIEDYARVMTEAMDALGVEKVSIYGDTVGTYVAVELANSYPKRVEKIILANCPYYPTKEYMKERHIPFKAQYRYDATGHPLPRTLEEVLAKDPGHTPMNPTQSWMDRDNLALMLTGRDLWQALDAITVYDFHGSLERLRVPTLLMWGEHFVYRQFQEEVIRRVKNNKVIVIKNGRFLLPVDHTDEVARAILEFLG
jgi:pimeloyl-ACP methyl ester carboxylesterase